MRFTKVIVAASVAALVLAAGVETATAKSHDQNMAKFSNDGNCALHFVVRRGNTNSEYRFILDSGQMVHLQLPYWSTYTSQCDSWPVGTSFSSVTFE
jgi:hypothetical protein